MKHPFSISHIVATFACCLVCTVISALPRTPEQALHIATSHRLQAPSLAHSCDTVAHDISAYIAHHSTGYYAVNTASGFVIVSADDTQPPVLAYSDSNQPFDLTNLPPAMQWWLSTYDMDCQTSFPQQPSSQTNTAYLPPTTIAPLLTCRWNQGAPFNLLAPTYNGTNHVAAGCVATAMAQIMYSYRHPEQGAGKHSYLWISQNDISLSSMLSVDFGATRYGWEHMIDYYTNAATQESQDAVATLLYHCGVSVDMGYDCNANHESGAVTSKVPLALATYFNYDTHYQSIRKDIYPTDSLISILYEELHSQHPVLVSGSNSEGGHAFVCDGYDGNGYFHFNWGWGGSSDGYFLLSALNPGSQGVGGTNKGYNNGTTFFIGLQPYNENAKPQPQQLAADSITLSAAILPRAGKFSIAAYRIQNYGLDDYTAGKVGVALYDEDLTQMVSLLRADAFSLKSNYYRTTPLTLSNLTIPAALPNGTYRLCFVYQDPVYGYVRMLNVADEYYKTLYLSDSQIEFVNNNTPAELILTQPIAFPYVDSIPTSGAPLAFSIRNTGGTFRGDISARIYQGKFSRGQYEVIDSVTIRHDEVFASALQQAFDPNLLLNTVYKMRLCYRANANDSWHEFTPLEYSELSFTLYSPEKDNPSTPTAVESLLQDGGHIVQCRLLLHLPVGDLYVVSIEHNQTIHHYKILQTL